MQNNNRPIVVQGQLSEGHRKTLQYAARIFDAYRNANVPGINDFMRLFAGNQPAANQNQADQNANNNNNNDNDPNANNQNQANPNAANNNNQVVNNDNAANNNNNDEDDDDQNEEELSDHDQDQDDEFYDAEIEENRQPHPIIIRNPQRIVVPRQQNTPPPGRNRSHDRNRRRRSSSSSNSSRGRRSHSRNRRYSSSSSSDRSRPSRHSRHRRHHKSPTRTAGLPRMKQYDGKTDVELFIKQFKSSASVYQWTRDEQLENLPLLLTDHAADVYHQLRSSEKNDIKRALKALRRHLMPSETEWLVKLNDCKPNKNEPTRDFALRLAKYYDRAYPDAKSSQRNRDLRLQLKRHLPIHLQTLVPSASSTDWTTTVQLVASEIPFLNSIDEGESSIEINRVQFSQSSKETQKSTDRRDKKVNNFNSNSSSTNTNSNSNQNPTNSSATNHNSFARYSNNNNNRNNNNNSQRRYGPNNNNNRNNNYNNNNQNNNVNNNNNNNQNINNDNTNNNTNTNNNNNRYGRRPGECGRCGKHGHYAAICEAPAPVRRGQASQQ
jgi:hypothetical protein